MKNLIAGAGSYPINLREKYMTGTKKSPHAALKLFAWKRGNGSYWGHTTFHIRLPLSFEVSNQKGVDYGEQ